MFSRIAWDPSVDADAIIDEYFRLMYGAAAGEMKAFFKSLEAKWTTGLLSQGEDTMWGPSFNVAAPEDRWNKVYTAELMAEYGRLFDVAVKKTAEGSLERRRVELMRREILEPLVDVRKEFVELPQRLAAVNFDFSKGKTLVLKMLGEKAEPVPADLRTEVVAEAKDDGLLVRITAYESDLAGTSAPERKLDDPDVWQDDGLELQIDPTGARREFVHIMVNSSGSWADLKHRKTGDGGWSADAKWDSGAKVAVRRLADRWICEIAIPSAVFNDGLPKKFPAEVFRRRVSKSGVARGKYNWGPLSSGACDFDRFGTWEIAR